MARKKSIDDITAQQTRILQRAVASGDVGRTAFGYRAANHRGSLIIKALNKGNRYKDNIRKTKAWQNADRSGDSMGPGNRLKVARSTYMGLNEG